MYEFSEVSPIEFNEIFSQESVHRTVTWEKKGVPQFLTFSNLSNFVDALFLGGWGGENMTSSIS